MGAREIVRAVLTAEPFQTLLSRVADQSAGRRILNAVDPSGGLFLNFEEGWAAARRVKPAGHEHPDAVRTHLDLSKSLRASDYAVLFWMCQISSGDLRVFDFGGNVGNLYYSYSRFLNSKLKHIEWSVFDLPAIRQEGRQLAKQRNAEELRFSDSVAEARDSDLLLVSGAFHYWEKSTAEFLSQFPQLPANVILNRTPVHDHRPSFVTVQKTRTYAVPCIVRNASQLISEFGAAGYEMVDRWSALDLSLRMPLYPKHSVPHYSGFYFRRNKSDR